MEFSTLNGYKVKDKKAIRYYDTVADMKSDTTLKVGMHVRTKGYYTPNDGGHGDYIIKSSTTRYNETLNNELSAELIIGSIVNPEVFGAYGDGVHDDTLAIQTAIDNSNNVEMNKIYLIDEIEIEKGDFTLNFNKIIGSIKVIATNLIQFLKINGKRLVNEEGDGLVLISSSGTGIQYCHFTINLIRATNCIKLDSSNGGWINNNYFEETNVSYGTGITSVALNNLYYNGNIFNKIGFEDITKWFTINNFEETKFDNCRMIPFEADGTSTVHELGTLINSMNVTFENNSNGTYFEFINTSNNARAIKFFNKVMQSDGVIIAKYLLIRNGVIQKIESPSQQLVLDIGSLESGTFPVEMYDYDLTKPIILDYSNGSRYMYMNLNIPQKYESALKTINIIIKGTTGNELDIRLRNQAFHVYPSGTSDVNDIYVL